MCVRAGQKQWRHLLAVAPERFAAAKAHEEQLRTVLGDVAILRERRAGTSYPLPLRELRRRATSSSNRSASGSGEAGAGCGGSHALVPPPVRDRMAISAIDV